jgi:serine phosphatase RsbU (regulator of sigma subunit)
MNEVMGYVDTSFDRYARMVRNALHTPIALVSIIQGDRQVFPGAVGLPEPYQTTRETPLAYSFCEHVIADDRPLVTSDAREDARFASNPVMDELSVIAYAGWPIHDHTGRAIGTLCAIDTEPRQWTEIDLQLLEDLAVACSTEVSERALRLEAAGHVWQAHALSDRSRVLLALSERLSTTATLQDVAAAVESIALDQLGCLRAGMWLRNDPLASRTVEQPVAEPVASGLLTFIRNPESDWRQASEHGPLALSTDNPLGAALLQDSPLFFADRLEYDAGYPNLPQVDRVGEARAFLPLRVRQEVYGALALLWPDRRELSEDDRVTISALTSYTAQSVQRALLLQDRINALVTLQRSLLPRLPRPGDLELAARYRPADSRDQVGGDWYDAVVMRSGETSLMIGDVVGHDMGAAAVMGQLRTMLRTIAWAGDDSPARNVARLDRAMHDLGIEGMATLVKARIEPHAGADGGWRLAWTNAGHPPPLLIAPDGTTALLETSRPDLMIGILPETQRTDNRESITAGSTLLLYTDGLVERRGEDITVGLDRLRASAARHHELPAAAFLDAVMADLVGARLEDDVALLAVRFNPQTTH